MQTVITIIVFCTLLLLLAVLPAWEQNIEAQRKVESTSPSPTGSLQFHSGNGAGIQQSALGLTWELIVAAA